MNRREVVLSFAALSVMSLEAMAQQPARRPRIGFLASTARPSSLSNGNYGRFLQGLNELGYVDGKNIAIEWRFADGRAERFAGYAEELVRANVDVIVAVTGFAAVAARQATKTIPIVMVAVGDAASYGFVNSLGRPNGNVTGLTNISVEVGNKHLEYLRTALPKMKSVAVLVNNGPGANLVYAKRVEAAAGTLGIVYSRVQAGDLGQIEGVMRQLAKERIDALILSPDAFYSTHSREIARLANENRIPTMFWTREHVVAGGFMSYGQNNAEHYYRAPAYIDKLLKGAKPADLPIEQPTKIELVVNSTTAKVLGIALPQELRLRAEEVIE